MRVSPCPLGVDLVVVVAVDLNRFSCWKNADRLKMFAYLDLAVLEDRI